MNIYTPTHVHQHTYNHHYTRTYKPKHRYATICIQHHKTPMSIQQHLQNSIYTTTHIQQHIHNDIHTKTYIQRQTYIITDTAT